MHFSSIDRKFNTFIHFFFFPSPTPNVFETLVYLSRSLYNTFSQERIPGRTRETKKKWELVWLPEIAEEKSMGTYYKKEEERGGGGDR